MSLPGDILRTYAQVIHPDGSPDAGRQMILDQLLGPDGELESTRYSFREVGGGFYEIMVATYAGDPFGNYEVHFHADNDIDGVPENSVFSQSWGVSNPIPISPWQDGNIGTSRLVVRQMVAGMLNDYWTGMAATSDETAAIVDPVQFARESNYFKGMQIHFTNPESPNYGRVATVTLSDGPSRTIYFEPPLPGPIVVGDTIDMYNFRGRGTTVDRYNAAINDSIRMARQMHFLVPYSYTFTAPFVRTSPYITIPQEFVRFHGLEMVDASGYLYQVRPGDIIVDRMARRVEVRKRGAIERLHGRTMTIRGLASPGLLNTDEDRTTIELDWFLNEVKAQLLERLILGGQPVGAQDRVFLQERTEANGKRSVIVTQAMPNAVQLG